LSFDRRRVSRRLNPFVWVAAAWALLALRSAKRQLADRRLDHVVVRRPPPLPSDTRRAVVTLLRRRHATCLLEALVLQRWDAARGQPRDLVIGVTAPGDGFLAHAWLDGDVPCHDQQFVELVRRGAR
jgi:hypothetical protein